MVDQIIPEKPNLFKPKVQERPQQKPQPQPQQQPIRLAPPKVRPERAPEEESPIFNIPQTFQAQQPLPMMIPITEKKSSWKRWIIIIAVIIIVSGLGYYFLSG